MLRETLRDLLALLAPGSCALCRVRVESPLCAACEEGLPWLDQAERCGLCGGGLASASGAARACARCAQTRSPLDACTAAVALEEPVLGWIHAFKYPGPQTLRADTEPGVVLRELACAAARRAPGPRPDLVVPIPLHPRRLRTRGFNQSAVLARAIARSLGLRLDCGALTRTRYTPPQTGLGRTARRRNVDGAFACASRGALPARVWLVDDVTTTGATLESAARVLRAAGAAHVSGVCVARRLDD